MCGRLCAYPAGFELDHIIALDAAGAKGEDTEDNVQVLCAGPNGCHARKTATDMGYRHRETIGLDGYPVAHDTRHRPS
jgi:5-methylcytosine-specific restriction endonuclease McrA